MWQYAVNVHFFTHKTSCRKNAKLIFSVVCVFHELAIKNQLMYLSQLLAIIFVFCFNVDFYFVRDDSSTS